MKDCLSIKSFLGPELNHPVPHRTTTHHYRNRLDYNVIRELFKQFSDKLNEAGYRVQDSQMVDPPFMLVPSSSLVQIPLGKPNAQGRRGSLSLKEDKASAKLQQNDTDAGWTKQKGKSIYGYKTTFSSKSCTN